MAWGMRAESQEPLKGDTTNPLNSLELKQISGENKGSKMGYMT